MIIIINFDLVCTIELLMEIYLHKMFVHTNIGLINIRRLRRRCRCEWGKGYGFYWKSAFRHKVNDFDSIMDYYLSLIAFDLMYNDIVRVYLMSSTWMWWLYYHLNDLSELIHSLFSTNSMEIYISLRKTLLRKDGLYNILLNGILCARFNFNN